MAELGRRRFGQQRYRFLHIEVDPGRGRDDELNAECGVRQIEFQRHAELDTRRSRIPGDFLSYQDRSIVSRAHVGHGPGARLR